MDARIEARGRILLVGMGFFGDPFAQASAWDEENAIGSLWKRFFAFTGSSPDAIADRADSGSVGYELHIAAPETEKTGRYEVFVGLEVLRLESLPVACSAKILPPMEYAVITVRGDEIRGDWMGKLYSDLVPGLGRKADESFSFERYDERFKGMDKLDESEIEYFIPLLPPAGAR
jgi:predicted transcriptional regulator YdeE